MSYVEIIARLELRYVDKRSPEDDSHLCNSLQEEIEALLDRLHKGCNIGSTSGFDIDKDPLIKVYVVE